MVDTNYQKKKSKIWNQTTKIKKLQKIGGNALCVIIPKSWIESNDWNKNTHLVMTFDPYNKKITILPKPEEIIINEKVNNIVTVAD